MPVKIDIERTITDYDNRTVKTDKIGHGLKQDRYISEISETDKALKSAIENSDIPNEPVYEINKLPFKYEFKYHMYYPSKRICEIPIKVR